MSNTTKQSLYLFIFFVYQSIFFHAQYHIYAKVNRNQPHGHFGKIPKYTPGPFTQISIDANDEKILNKGDSIMKTIPADDDDSNEGGGGGGRAICIQDVQAPKEAVWNQILDMDSYQGKVSKLKECKNYFIKACDDGKVQFKTKMVIGVLPGYSYENYYDHTYHPKENSVTWSLDYAKTNDFDDVSGHWHVEDHPTKGEGHTRVFYACDLKFKTALPGPVMSFLTKSALKSATGWVKKESELHPNGEELRENVPREFGFATQ